MNVIVKFFGQHKEELNKSEIEIELKDSVNLDNLIQILKNKEPKFAKFDSYAIAVNLNYENLNYTIEDGDEIAIIPPVSGG